MDLKLLSPITLILSAVIFIFASTSFAGSISGVIRAESDGSPMVGITVEAYDAYFSEPPDDVPLHTTTREDGSYTITGVWTGSFKIHAYYNFSGTYLHAYYDQTNDPGSASTVTVSVDETRAGIDFSITRLWGQISGIVTSEKDGSPVSGITVLAGASLGSSRSATTQSDGRYVIDYLRTDNYIVRTYSGNSHFGEYYDNADQDSATLVPVTQGETTSEINFSLAQGGKITGVTTERSDGSPLEGMGISANGIGEAGSGSTKSGSDGAYTISGLEEGSYRVYVANDGNHMFQYYNDTTDYGSAAIVSVSFNSTTSGVDFSLDQGGKITGIVTADSDGSPLEGIGIYVYDEAGDQKKSTRSLSDGSYIIMGLPSGNYRVYAKTNNEYRGEYYNDALSLDTSTPVPVSIAGTTGDINFSLSLLPLLGNISGKVTAESDGSPIPGVSVRATDEETGITRLAHTTFDGTYTISELPAGNYKVRALQRHSREEYIEEYYDNAGDSASATLVPVTSGETTSGIDFSMPLLYGQVSGFVTSDSDGSPMEDVRVYVGGYSTYTRSDGSYIINDIETGNYSVYAHGEGEYLNKYYNNSYDLESSTPVSVTQGWTTSNINLSLVKGGKITGTVTERLTGSPIEDMSIYLRTSSGVRSRSTKTQADGSYSFARLSEGDYILEANSYTNYLSQYYSNTDVETSATPVAVSVNETTSGIDFQLDKYSSISGTVYKSDGITPLANIDIYLFQDPCGRHYMRQTSTNEYGNYTIGDLVKGNYYIKAYIEQNFPWRPYLNYLNEWYNNTHYCSEASPVTIETGVDIENMDFRLEDAASISGTVFREDGITPIANISVEAFSQPRIDQSAFLGYAVTDASGNYTIRGIPEGDIYILARGGYSNLTGRSAPYVGEWFDDMLNCKTAEPIVVDLGDAIEGINFQLLADSDYDGMSDSFETTYFGDLSRDGYVDVDDDGLSNVQEYRNGTDPTLKADTDGDGMPDDWEMAYFGVLTRDGTGDLDDDDLTDLEDYRAGTDPTLKDTDGDGLTDLEQCQGMPSSVSGRVLGSDGITPLSGIWIVFYSTPCQGTGYDYISSTNTDESGNYRFYGLTGTEVYIKANSWQPFGGNTDYAAQWYGGTTACNDALPVSLSPGMRSDNIDFQLTDGGSISGTVYESDGATTISGISVTASLSPCGDYNYILGSAISDANGTYTIPGLPSGNVYLFTYNRGKHYIDEIFNNAPNCNEADPVEVASGENTDNIDFQLDYENGNPEYDFNGDWTSDILWRNKSNYKTYIWLMDGKTVKSYGYTSLSAGAAWKIEGTGDFNNDGKKDILWRNTANYKTYIWFMNGKTVKSHGYISLSVGSAWEIQGIGDFDDNGTSDILWRNKSNYTTYIWFMNGKTVKSKGYTSSSAGSAWKIEGIGDFDDNGTSDILWRNKSNYKTYIWLMDGKTVSSKDYTSLSAGSAWTIEGIGDFDDNGTSDILWRNKSTYKTYIWFMNGKTVKSHGYTSLSAGSAWEIQGIGDFDDNGTSDMLWRNKSNYKTYLWLMDGRFVNYYGYTTLTAGAAWEIE